jgi:hypothetical protein
MKRKSILTYVWLLSTAVSASPIMPFLDKNGELKVFVPKEDVELWNNSPNQNAFIEDAKRLFEARKEWELEPQLDADDVNGLRKKHKLQN